MVIGVNRIVVVLFDKKLVSIIMMKNRVESMMVGVVFFSR